MTTTLTLQAFEFPAYDAVVRFEASRSESPAMQSIRASRHFHQREMLEDIGRLLPENACVVDIGAGIGNQAVFFSRIAGATTIAIESEPQALRTLRANIELNGIGSSVEVHSGTPGRSGRAKDKTRSVDEIVGARDVALLRFGAEAFFAAALEGAMTTIERCRPWIVIEGDAAMAPPVDALLRPLGYRLRRRHDAGPAYCFEPVIVAANAAGSIRPKDLARLPRTAQVVAGMATVAGNEVALRAAVVSLLPQVDRLYLYLNHFDAPPTFVAQNPKITWIVDADGRRYGDAGKFWGLPQARDSIYLTCDDDIVYPPDYAASMIRELAALDGRAIVGVHGSLVLQPCGAHYEMKGRAVFHYENALMRRRQVHIAGSGTAAFHSSVVTMTLEDFAHPNMADIWLAKFARTARLPSYVIPRPDRWLSSLEVKRPTIYQQSAGRTGSAYDSSQRQDQVLSTLYPLSIGRAEQAQRPVATFIVARTSQGLDDAIAAACARDRDAVVFVLDDSADDRIRQAAHQVRFRTEIHLLRPGDSDASRDAVKALLDAASAVRCFEVKPGAIASLAPDAWIAHLAQAPRSPTSALPSEVVASRASPKPSTPPVAAPRAAGSFPGSATYWEERYAKGGNSGAGSYSLFAAFKAEVLNAFVAEHRLRTVIEFGSGDGNQLTLATYPSYLGFDVSDTAIAHCRRLFAADPSRRFLPVAECEGHRAELSMSLDVIFHLVEDNVFDRYMQNLFASSDRYVVIYASDREDSSGKDGPHVRHRLFSKWIAENAADWKLFRHLPNKYPYRGDHTKGSFAEFFFYSKG